MSGSWSTGSTSAWRRVRAAVLLRDGYSCRVRVPGVCTLVATTGHHTLGRGRTGDDPAYVVAACAACNLHVGDPSKQPDPPSKAPTRW